MEQKEFKIPSRENNQFRIAKLDPTEVLALAMTMDLNEYKQTKATMDFALEHIEVNVGDNKWIVVKQKDRNVYMPMGIEEDYKALKELIEYFIEEVLSKVF